jgi:hypothetical protein
MITIIVPQGYLGGVYQYAVNLHDKIGAAHNTRIIALTPDNLETWVNDPSEVVFLQMSGYGFQKRGAPLWLVREMQKRRSRIRALGVFFHEIYAFGPPWTSSFWLSPVQRYIARCLMQSSDFWMTNRMGAAQWLNARVPGKRHAVLPVCSNIGEPELVPEKRARKVVVFGSPALRESAYRLSGVHLFEWARRENCEIHDVGGPIPDQSLSRRLRVNGVIQHGFLESDSVQHMMLEAMFGLVAYPSEYAAKSSVFAAFSSHGLCPVLLSSRYLSSDGLEPGIHYCAGFPKDSSGVAAANVAARAMGWYQSHSLSKHAQCLSQFIDNCQGLKC